jgi:hypothetical protein
MAFAFKEYSLWPMRDATERTLFYLVVEAFKRAVVVALRRLTLPVKNETV